MACDKAEVSILLTGDREMQELNRKWLNRDRTTDVLSFPQNESQSATGFQPVNNFLGDVAISLETADRQARELGHSLDSELARLLAHGLLHLLGHDHVHGGAQARKMRKEEARLVEEVEKEER